MQSQSFSRESLLVGTAGYLEISLPVLEFGAGNPTVLMLVGLHGDELTGYLMLLDLFERLSLKKGTLRVIMAANPMGLALQQREEPINNKDINRSFPGDPKGNFTHRLAAKLLEQAEQSDCVLDFHTFYMHRMRLTAIFMNHGTREVRERSLRLIHAFAPEVIWQLDTRTEEQQQWAGSMGPEMAGRGIVNFAIELPAVFWANNAVVHRATDGVLRVLAALGMVEDAPAPPEGQPLVYTHREVDADRSGIWMPREDLLEALIQGKIPHVAEGDLLGHLVDFSTLERVEKCSPYTGPIVALLPRMFVRTGDEICTIGGSKPWAMLAEGTLEKIAVFAEKMDWWVAFGGKSAGNKHLERVARLAAYLAEREPDADTSICRAGAWLHDIGLTVDPKGPASLGNPIAESFLLSLGEKDVDAETRGRILHCIESHDYGVPGKEGVEPTTVEARIVHDADALDKRGPLAVIRETWKLVNSGMDLSAEEVLERLQRHFAQPAPDFLLTQSGRHLAEKIDALYGDAFRQFFEDKEKALLILSGIMKWAKEGLTSEEIVSRLGEQYDDAFSQALQSQIAQKYLEDAPAN